MTARSKELRISLVEAIEHLIELLDELDGDPDFEASEAEEIETDEWFSPTTLNRDTQPVVRRKRSA